MRTADNKNTIKDILRKNKYLRSIKRLMKTNNPTLLDRLTGSNNHLHLSLQNTEIKFDMGKPIYLIAEEWNTNGFFAIMRKVLNGCLFSEQMGLMPYIYIIDSIYNVKGGINGTNNMFEYYFKQPFDLKYNEIIKNYNYIMYENCHSILIERELSGSDEKSDKPLSEYNNNYSYIQRLGDVYSRYFLIKDELKTEFERDFEKLKKEDSKMIGIHFRGTGWENQLYGHPNPVRIEQCVEIIDEYDPKEYKYIFIATDNCAALEYLVKKFKDRVVFYKDVTRSKDGSEVQLTLSDRERNGYYLGKEVLRDSLSLSKCEVLIAGLSQVSLFAQIQKKSRNEMYDEVHIIDNGICNQKTIKGKKYRREVNEKAKRIVNGVG